MHKYKIHYLYLSHTHTQKSLCTLHVEYRCVSLRKTNKRYREAELLIHFSICCVVVVCCGIAIGKTARTTTNGRQPTNATRKNYIYIGLHSIEREISVHRNLAVKHHQQQPPHTFTHITFTPDITSQHTNTLTMERVA